MHHAKSWGMRVIIAAGFLVALCLPAHPQTCQVQGIKRTFTSPSRVTCQVQYSIPASYPKACFISAYVPNHANQHTSFSYNPAGRLPAGVPKGQHYFADNIAFEVFYNGAQPYTSSTIEVVIYDSDQTTLCTTIIQWGQTWSKESPQVQCQVQGIKRTLTTPSRVTCQVQYFIPASYPKACFISAYVPNQANLNRSFHYTPAGRLPAGVPKGQHYFADNIFFEVFYDGAQPYTSSTIEVDIYDSDQAILCTSIIPWGQVWRR